MRRQLDGLRPVLPMTVGVVVLLVAVVWFPAPAPLGVLVSGALTGGRIALVALGLALIWRTNRVIDFAQADLGSAPAILAVLLRSSGCPRLAAPPSARPLPAA